MRKVGIYVYRLIGFLLSCMMVSTFVPLFFRQLNVVLSYGSGDELFAFSVLGYSMLGIAFLWFVYWERIFSLSWKDVGIVLIAIVGLRLVAFGASKWLMQTTGTPFTANDVALLNTGLPLLKRPVLLAVFIVMVCLIIPIVEELIFRGLYFKCVWCKRYKWFAGGTSSLLFAYWHVTSNDISFGLYFILGCIFFFVYAGRGNLLESILAHIGYNIVMLCVFGLPYVRLL